jgi:hypothetical protein
MVGEPDATMQPAPQDNQLMSKHRVLSLQPYLRLEWRGQDGQNETEQPDHSASLGDSITSSTRISFRYTQDTSLWPATSGLQRAKIAIECPLSGSKQRLKRPKFYNLGT